jgi:hypothetical protein
LKYQKERRDLFVDDMILYLKGLKDSTKIPLDLTNTGKVVGYKINIQKSVTFLYTKTKQAEREIEKIIPFTIASKVLKISRNKLN